MKAGEIMALLRARYRPPEWAFFEEIRCGTGYTYGGIPVGTAETKVEKRLDAWAFHLWPTGGYQPTGFEIKVSRSDFLRDLKKPAKRSRYLELCQFFYYVVPSGLVKASEVPADAGLLGATLSRLTVMKPAPHREIPPPEWEFFAAICRRVGDAGWPKYSTIVSI